jgi:Zn/Cd-binding protein ZinT
LDQTENRVFGNEDATNRKQRDKGWRRGSLETRRTSNRAAEMMYKNSRETFKSGYKSGITMIKLHDKSYICYRFQNNDVKRKLIYQTVSCKVPS